LVPTPLILFGTSPPCSHRPELFIGWVSEKKHELYCLFGASREAPKNLPNGQKPPNGRHKYPEKRCFDSLKKGFLVLFLLSATQTTTTAPLVTIPK
jgi:hypothetical protein